MKTAKVTFWKIIAVIIFVFGLYAAFVRFTKGLGASTNLSDQFPWGLWVGFDVLVGVGLAAGGFVIAATVHIFNMEKYEPIARPAILTAFLGYLLVVVALMFDLGRPYRIWHPLVMWNPHSVMFEVAWCVTLYTIVLALEFSPMVFECCNLKVPLKLIKRVYLPIVIAGVMLSTLHQSSLGTLYVIVPDKLYGIWYSPFLPVFFFITAISAGLAMTIIESFLSYRAFGRRLEKDLLEGIARVIVVVLAVYLVFKFQDLSRRGNLHLVFELNRESVLFWGEMGLGVILPMLLLYVRQIREKESGLFFSALLVVLGFIVSRLNVSITGMLHSETYFPKWTEIAVTLSVVAFGFVIFAFAVKRFRVFPEKELTIQESNISDAAERRHPVFTGNVVVAMWALLILGMVTLGLTKTYKDNHQKVADDDKLVTRTVHPLEQELKLPADFDFPLGEDSPGVVTFSHANHIAAQEKPNCAACHSGTFNILKDGKSNLQTVTMDAMYEGKSCGTCHNGEDAFNAKDECDSCHQE